MTKGKAKQNMEFTINQLQCQSHAVKIPVIHKKKEKPAFLLLVRKTIGTCLPTISAVMLQSEEQRQ